jgi:hypothetical protein
MVNRMKGVSEAEERIADAAARAADAMEKRAAATRTEKMDVDKLHAAHVALNEATKAYAAEKLNAEGKYNALLADALELTRKITNTKKAGLDPVEWETKLLEKQRDIRAAGITLIQAEGAAKVAAIESAGILDTTYEQRMATLKNARIVLEGTLRKMIEATGAKSAETGAAELALQDNLKKQLTAQFDLIKKQGEERAKVTLEGKEYERLLVLQLKAATGLTFQENEELKVLVMKTKERELSLQIETALALRRTQTGAEVSEAEEKILVKLIGQRDKLHEQIEAKGKQIKAVNDEQLPAENKVTQALVDQGKQIDENAKKSAAAAAAEALAADRKSKLISDPVIGMQMFAGGGTQNYQSMSTAMLTGLVDKQNMILNSVDSSGRLVRDATYMLGDVFAKEMANAQKYSIEKELNLRREIQDYGMRMGDIATIMKYGDAQTQRAFNAVTQGADKTNTMLARISQQLSASGIFGTGGGIG